MKTDRLRPTRNVVDARRGRQPRVAELRGDMREDEGYRRPPGTSSRNHSINRRIMNANIRNDTGYNNRDMFGSRGVERDSGVSPVVRQLNERDTVPNQSPDPHTPNSRAQRLRQQLQSVRNPPLEGGTLIVPLPERRR